MTNHEVELRLAGLEGALEQHVDMISGPGPVSVSRLYTSTLHLGGLAVMVVKLAKAKLQ
jgi:hypothetical protein